MNGPLHQDQATVIQKLMQDVGQLVSRYSPQGGSGLLSTADSGAEVEDSIVRKVTGNVCSLDSFLTTGTIGHCLVVDLAHFSSLSQGLFAIEGQWDRRTKEFAYTVEVVYIYSFSLTPFVLFFCITRFSAHGRIDTGVDDGGQQNIRD